ncbi:MAG: PP2C family protein-serine/threonine phosphatase [Gemmatimonadaceae bacterium]
MKDLRAVLAAFQDATQCAVAVWIADDKNPPTLAAATSAGAVLAPDTLPDTEHGAVLTNAGRVMTTRLAGPKRAWMTVGPCEGDQLPLERNARLLLPVVNQMMRTGLEMEHTAAELAGRYEEISLLYTISEILGRTVTLEEAATTILTELSQTVGARRGAILLYDRPTTMLYAVAAIGIEQTQLTSIPINDMGSVAARVFRTRHLGIADSSESTSEHEAIYSRDTMLAAPIIWTSSTGSLPLGVVILSERERGQPFSAGDQKLVAAIATQIGIAIQNSRLVRASMDQQRLQQEMLLAHDLQMKLLPQPASLSADAEIAARVVPAESVGGDFYHLFRLGNASTGVMIGDVSSHGYRAALIMALTMSAASIHAQIHSDPGAMLGALLGSVTDELTTTEMFVTLFYGVVNRKKSVLHYANTGHPHAFLFGPDGKCDRLPALDPPLGMVDAAPHAKSLPWHPKESLLLLFTDGISDARNSKGDRLGEQRVLDAVKKNRKEPVDVILEKVFESLRRFSGRTPLRDDQTLVILRA